MRCHQTEARAALLTPGDSRDAVPALDWFNGPHQEPGCVNEGNDLRCIGEITTYFGVLGIILMEVAVLESDRKFGGSAVGVGFA